MAHPEKPETQPNCPKGKTSLTIGIGAGILITSLIYTIITGIMSIAGNPTPLYEPDNPWTYSIRQGTRWIMIGALLLTTRRLLSEAYAAWQNRRTITHNAPQSQLESEIKIIAENLTAITSLTVAYLASKLIIGLIQGGTLGEMANPLAAEDRALSTITSIGLSITLFSFALNRAVIHYAKSRSRE